MVETWTVPGLTFCRDGRHLTAPPTTVQEVAYSYECRSRRYTARHCAGYVG